MRDGEILDASPPDIVGHVNVAFSHWRDNMPHA